MNMSAWLIQFFFLLLPQVICSDTETQGWTFTFPESISVIKNSDVTIPCSFTSPDNQSEVNVIWYKYQTGGYPQIFNSKEPSLVISEYSGRTALVGNGTDDCSLKITNVRDTDEFFPGISDKINSWDLNMKNIKVQASGCSDRLQCPGWWFLLQYAVDALEGSCMDLRCTFIHPKDAGDFNLFWYKGRNVQLFNKKSQRDVDPMYKGRTLLTGDTRNNCSIRINDIKKEDKGPYYVGVNTEINSFTLQDQRTVTVTVSEKPPRPSLNVTKVMKEDKPVTIICSVSYACASDPPTLTWNMTGHPITQESKYDEWYRGLKMESIMTYTPSYTEDGQMLECVATFPNNKTSKITERLKIKYLPKEVRVSVVGDMETTEGDNVTLHCTSQANPPKTQYTWYQIRKSGRLLQGDGDTITVKYEATKQYICTATNAMGTGESPAFPYDGIVEDGRDFSLIGGIATGVGLVALVLIAILITFYRKKICCRPASSPEQPLEDTYTALQGRENVEEYATLKPRISEEPNATSTEYENIPKKASR